ncbi:MAG: Ig-like domain-containing protein [Planctomycetota bacterium]
MDTASNLTDWSILGGNEDGNFSFDLSSGNLLVADNVNLNFESNSTYVLTVAVSDGSQTSVPETIVVNVSDVNERPVALPESLVTDQFEGLFVLTPGVLGNDTDVDGDVLAAALISGPSNGTLSLAPDGSIIYTPLGDFFGRDSFTYFATDGLLNSLPVTVEVFVQPIGNSINHQTSNYQVESTPSLVVTQVPITPVTNPVEASLQQAKKVLGIQHLPQSTIAEAQPQVLVAADVEEDPFADEEGPEKIYEDQEPNFQPIRRIQKLSSRVTSSNSSERISTTRLSAAPIRNSSFGDEMEEPGSGLVDNLVVGTTAITTASLSVGYVLWIVRGGTLMASFVSTLPAWTSFDPLPIVKNSGLDDDSESLVDIAEKGMERHDRDKLND